MRRIELTHRFPVSVQDGFGFITEPANWPLYWPGLREVKGASHWGEVGGTANVVLSFLGRPTELAITLEEWVPDARVGYRSVQRGLPEAHHQRIFEPDAAGFRYTMTVEYEERRGPGLIVDGLLAPRAIRRALEQTAANLDDCFARRAHAPLTES